MAEFLHVVPKLVLVDILSSWLLLLDVGRFDSAVCTKYRGLFHQSLTACSFRIIEKQNRFTAPFVEWCDKRKIQLNIAALVLDECLVNNRQIRVSLLRRIGKRLLKINTSKALFDPDKLNRALLDVSTFCSNLQECTIHAENDSTVMALLGRNSQLRRICIIPNKKLECDYLESFVHMCSNLVDIDIRCSISAIALQNFLGNEPAGLQRLRLPCCDAFDLQILSSMIVRCTFLSEVAIGLLHDHYETRVGMKPLNQIISFQTVWCTIHDTFVRLFPFVQTLIIQNPAPAAIHTIMHEIAQLQHLRQFCGTTDCEHLMRSHPLPPLPHTHTGSCLEAIYVPLCTFEPACLFTMHPMLRAFGFCHLWNEEYWPEFFTHGLKCLAVTQRTISEAVCLSVCNLEALHLLEVQGLTDKMMTYLALRNPSLRVLTIHHVTELTTNFTFSGLRAFLKHCPQLEHVEYTSSVRGVAKVKGGYEKSVCVPSAADIELGKAFCEMYPNLTYMKCCIATSDK